MEQKTGSVAAIFKRGGQKAEFGSGIAPADEQQQLEQHLTQLSQAWGAAKSRKGLAAAVWRPAVGAFEVVNRGRQLFTGQGFMHNKKLYLHAEQAVYLMDRASVLLFIEQHPQQQQQQQQQQQPRQQQQQRQQGPAGWRLLSMQEALHMMAALKIPADRLLVLSHLSRLGFTLTRHPACWLVPPELPPCSTWQATPAWADTDGLLLLLRQPPALSPPPAAGSAAPNGGAAAGGGGAAAAAACTGRQPVERSQQQQQQQQQARGEQVVKVALPEQKRRKLEQQQQLDHTQQQQDQQQQQQQPQPQQEHGGSRAWYAATPAWLQPQQQQQQQEAAALEVEPVLLGVQLRQRFPLLRPLQRYRDADTHHQHHIAGSGGAAGGGGRPAPAPVAELVFDALLNQPHFSYKAPPRPAFSIAMPRCAPQEGGGCGAAATLVPPLDELLDLAAAAAGGGSNGNVGNGNEWRTGGGADGGAGSNAGGGVSAVAAAAGEGLQMSSGEQGQQQQQQQQGGVARRVCYQALRFALPEEGGVGFCEVAPIRLMDLLANSG